MYQKVVGLIPKLEENHQCFSLTPMSMFLSLSLPPPFLISKINFFNVSKLSQFPNFYWYLKPQGVGPMARLWPWRGF